METHQVNRKQSHNLQLEYKGQDWFYTNEAEPNILLKLQYLKLMDLFF